MSDHVRDLAKRFDRDVRYGYPRNIGLFPIPEYPELDDQGMWSSALQVLLTTLRYLAPAALLTLFWGQQSFLFRLLKCIDNAFRAIVFSNEEEKAQILQWLSSAGPVRVERLETVWRHGWVLCGVLDASLPGACQGHPPASLSLRHAKNIASQYLGVESVFTDEELEANDSISKHQEWKLVAYLDQIRKALAKLSPPVSKPTSNRTSPEMAQITFDYVARGSGLAAAQVKNKMHFKIYPTSQQCLNPGEITILIRGPNDTYGMMVIPPIFGKAQLIRQKFLGLQSKPSFTENALPLTQGATYLRTFGRNNMDKTYYIPKPQHDIDIEVATQIDYAKVGYVVNLEGKYEISITTRGQNIVGSPFTVKAAKNIFEILEKDSFSLEDGEEIDIVDNKSDRKVVLRIVDFVTEKMLLRENGTLEKITDDEAKILMSTDKLSDYSDIESQTCSVQSTRSDEFNKRRNTFNKAARKIVQMNRVCKTINNLLAEKRKKEKAFIRPRSQQNIPDIVNSTFSEVNLPNSFTPEIRDKYIVPKNINVALRTEKPEYPFDPEITAEKSEGIGNTALNTTSIKHCFQESVHDRAKDNNATVTTVRPNSSNNPFLDYIYKQNCAAKKDLGSVFKTDYETNKSLDEETEGTPTKILVENPISPTPSPSPTNTNPFFEPDVITLERPKTPILKIITGDIQSRVDSLFVDPTKAEEILGSEIINPLFLQHHQDSNEKTPVTDFIIGASVSLPPIIRAATPEPEMKSLLMTENNVKLSTNDNRANNEVTTSTFLTPLPTLVNQISDNHTICSSTFYSMNSSISDNIENSSLSNVTDNSELYQHIQVRGDCTPERDERLDSAYVSNDDNNILPDSNNNDKHANKISSCDINYNNMGPAEREIWKSGSEAIDTTFYEEANPKSDIKIPIFTPILEDSDRSMSTSLKDIGPLAVTVAFAELNDMYRNFFHRDDSDSPEVTTNEGFNFKHRKEESVNSASESSDVKRHAENQEDEISEVQANVTESVSASQTHQQIHHKIENIYEAQLGDTSHNIVLEKTQYWDKIIQEIQAKSSEEDLTEKKRKLSSRHLRQNYSLTNERGKQLDRKFCKASRDREGDKEIEIFSRKSPISHNSPDLIQKDAKIVEKWKNYWDNKLQSEKDETITTCWRATSPRSKESSASPQKSKYSTSSDDFIEAYNEPLNEKTKTMPGKHELPEEIFEAFEISPKRFFGTSRTQILNKIDTFLGKPSTAGDSSPERSGAKEHNSGLVSSRVSLFHTISKKKELPTAERKSESMHNIFQRKDSDKSIIPISEDENFDKIDKIEIYPQKGIIKKPGLERKFSTILSQGSTEFEQEPNPTLKQKRTRIVQSAFNTSFDDSSYQKPSQTTELQDRDVKKTINEYNKFSKYEPKHKSINALRKSSVSKSEMDIFSKMTKKTVEDDFGKHKSMEELPKINVKSFINLYEKVSRADEQKPMRKLSRTKSLGIQRISTSSLYKGAVNKSISTSYASKLDKPTSETDESTTDLTNSPSKRWDKDPESMSSGSYEPRSLDSVDLHVVSTADLEKQTTYVSLSDIELEIVENIDQPIETVKNKERIETAPFHPKKESQEVNSIDYKSRFKRAKEFFQSLDELREVKKPKKLNDCEVLLLSSKSSESTESLHKEPRTERIPKRVKKNVKAHSMPSSEISKIWDELQESQNSTTNKLVKISEKFNVEDLFSDVMEGRLSRQGSLRGIPHKKAVLETFKSMENLTDKKISSYELAVTQLSEFAKENQIKNAQTYLSEYPYLPTTAPSKCQSRLDVNASGLISLKELHSQKPRRNSFPDIRLKPTSTVNLLV